MLTIIQTQNRIIQLLEDDIRLKDLTITLAKDELEFARQMLEATQQKQ
jgi:hypothetical protein